RRAAGFDVVDQRLLCGIGQRKQTLFQSDTFDIASRYATKFGRSFVGRAEVDRMRVFRWNTCVGRKPAWNPRSPICSRAPGVVLRAGEGTCARRACRVWFSGRAFSVRP